MPRGVWPRTERHIATNRATMLRNWSNPVYAANQRAAHMVRLTGDMPDQLRDLRAQKATWQEIASRLGIGTTQAINFGRHFGLVKPSRPRVTK